MYWAKSSPTFLTGVPVGSIPVRAPGKRIEIAVNFIGIPPNWIRPTRERPWHARGPGIRVDTGPPNA